MTRRVSVRITANLEANLHSIRAFLIAAGAATAYVQLLDELDKTVITNLERHPEMGRPFLGRPALSIEARDLIAKLSSRTGPENLREYLSGDYLILYAVVERTVYLLAIKHHRQLSFAFDRHWS
ncbi:MAG: type II toxin-antitoxin system RelE/ParE family toxin [Alphaproteobacteria bacterium]|nr:type II toxin-antitoxin system RelE/ParE family toxin [Alphaproteobacteria bacterium]